MVDCKRYSEICYKQYGFFSFLKFYFLFKKLQAFCIYLGGLTSTPDCEPTLSCARYSLLRKTFITLKTFAILLLEGRNNLAMNRKLSLMTLL